MPLPATCRSWLNWMGCSRATCACVTQGERVTSSMRPPSATTKKIAPKMLTREMVFVERWKICGIGRTEILLLVGRFLPHVGAAEGVLVEPLELEVGLLQEMMQADPLMPLAGSDFEVCR